MKIKILEKPFSLSSRALMLGLRAHCTNPNFPQNIVASHNHLRLIEYYKKHSYTSAKFVWVILDGFYILSNSFTNVIESNCLHFVDHILVVGDCGDIRSLQQVAKFPNLNLLFDRDIILPLAKKLSSTNAFLRLQYHIPPSSFYQAWDYIKCFRDQPSAFKCDNKLFFAGNDGTIGIKNVFTAINSAQGNYHIQRVDPKAYQREVQDMLQQGTPLTELMLYSLNYFASLKSIVSDSLLPNEILYFDDQSKRFDAIKRVHCLNTILFKSLFRITLLMWVAYRKLGIVITKPIKNRSYYAYSCLSSALMLDMGGLNGFEPIYPRSLDCMLYGKTILPINSTCKAMLDSTVHDDAVTYYNLACSIETLILNSNSC